MVVFCLCFLLLLSSLGFGWFVVSLCGDTLRIPDDYTLPADLNHTASEMATHVYGPYSMADLNYRLEYELRCEKWAWAHLAIAAVFNFAIGFGGILLYLACSCMAYYFVYSSE